MEFKKLKEKYEGEIVTEEQYDIIAETEWVYIENNGSSGKEVDCIWWTAQEMEGEGEVVDEFDFYTKRI